MHTLWKRVSCFALAAGLSCSVTSIAQADEEKKETAAEAPKPAVLVIDLENPSGVVVDPKTGHVFIASRYGVYRYDPVSSPKKINLEILNTQTPTDVYGKGPMYDVGPLGLAVMNDWLIVGDGSKVDGEELVRIYKITEAAPEASLKEDAAAFTLGPIKAGEQSAKGEGNYYGVAVVGESIFVTANGDDTKGWVAKVDVKEGTPGELTPFIATKVDLEVDAPAAATVTPDGKELLISQMGEINVEGDSLLAFYNPADGKLIRSLKTGLNDIVGLAYSPKSGKLYATEFSWMDTTKGALYRLDIEGETVTPVKIVDLDKPTGLAFDKEGKLYITVFGTKPEGEEKLSPGQLLSISGDL